MWGLLIQQMARFAVYKRKPGDEEFIYLTDFDSSDKAHEKASKENLKNIQKYDRNEIPLIRVVPFKEGETIPEKIYTIERLDLIVKKNGNLFPKRNTV